MPVLVSSVHWAAGSDSEANFGTTSLAALYAVSSRVAKYSFTAQMDRSGLQSLCHSCPAIKCFLLASATMSLASTAKSFATNQADRNTCLDDPFEHTTENITLAESFVAGTKKR